jgi:PAS domain S-box-containing protein
MESNSISIKQSFEKFYSHHARESLDELSENFTITDPSISGHPIIFASHAFLKMTGFTRDEVVGRSGSIFQGPATCRRSVLEIREAVREERETNVVLVNYRKNRTPFWILLNVSPVFCKLRGSVVHFVAVQVPLETRSRVCSSSSSSVQVHDFVFRCCRKEVCSDSLAEQLGRVSSGNHQVLEHDVTGSFVSFVLFGFMCCLIHVWIDAKFGEITLIHDFVLLKF